MPLWLLGVFIGVLPFLTILIVTFVFVPGATTPRHTPASLVWRRKLWELHTGTMGLVASNIIAFFFTQGMKNLLGKPRPDLLDRCQPDLDNAAEHAVGGFAGEAIAGRLYSASICQQQDLDLLDDGFRSCPSGHSSASAAGLVYLSLFLASKFAVAIPYVLHGSSSSSSAAAFPSHMVAADPLHDRLKGSGSPTYAPPRPIYGRNSTGLRSLRSQAAAPPLYLLAVVIAPLALSVYIPASRWFDFRHHGFDILFGYLIGLVPAIYCFRYYHLPVSGGAGWTWGPRGSDRAFWAGVGRTGYASEEEDNFSTVEEGGDKVRGMRSGEVDYGREDVSVQPSLSHSDGDGPSASRSRPYGSNAYASSGRYAPGGSRNPYDDAAAGGGGRDDYFDVEMQRMGNRR